MSSLLKYLLLSLSVVSLTACHQGSDEPDVPVDTNTRTVLVYIMAENSLSHFATDDEYVDPQGDISEMLEAACDIPDDSHLILFLDDANLSQNPRIYEVKKSKKEERGYLEIVKAYDEELCSTDPAVLRDVLQLVKASFPANGYSLVLWSHGSAWLHASKTRDTRSIGIDNENNSGSNTGVGMEITSLREVLEEFGKLDYLYFDACFMQAVEVGYELRNVADYIVSSPAETPGTGGAYHKMMASMFLAGAEKAAVGMVEANFNYYKGIYDLVSDLYDKYDPYYQYNYGNVMSAVKCSELGALARVTKPLIDKYVSGQTVLSLPDNVQEYNTKWSSYPDFYDMNGVLHQIADDLEYESWKTQFDKAVIVRRATEKWVSYNGWASLKSESDSPFGGLSMYVPKVGGNYVTWNSDFRDTSWHADVWSGTGW